MSSGPAINVNAVTSEIRRCIINEKANACPMAIRLAWHASGTFNQAEGSGGSDGATMRFEPESTDGANAGLSILRDMLKPVKTAHPNCSIADIWCLAGAAAVEFLGGPAVPCDLGRTDATATTVPNGLLPDAAQGAAHLRDVFYRQGFNDREIVALSGAHTLGRCHVTRSGFDGPWTSNPLKFDNEYFRNLLEKTWTKREWSGNEQFTDESGELMMLPTDIALLGDAAFRPVVEEYARDEAAFFRDFSAAFAKLIGNGCPAGGGAAAGAPGGDAAATAGFLEHAMHGSLERCQEHAAAGANVHAVEASSSRSALHKAAFWGHEGIVKYLIDDCKLDVNAADSNGDGALNDAVRFGHAGCVKMLLAAGADKSTTNAQGQDAAGVAAAYDQAECAALLA